MSDGTWVQSSVGDVATFEYGAALTADLRSGDDFPVFGSNGEVGRHCAALVHGPGIVVGRKGTVGALTWSASAFWPIDTAYYVKASEHVDLRWLYWMLSTLGLDRLDSSTGVPGLNRNDAYRLRIQVPLLREQLRIAEILDTIDIQVCATEQIIAKLKRTQEGLAARLLMCGMRTGEHYRDSTIGRVPSSWEVAPLERFKSGRRPYLKTGPFGSSLKQEHWVDEGVPVVTIGSLGDGHFVNSELLHISAKTAQLLSSYALEEGDIVFSRVADVGRSVVVDEREEGWIMSSNMMWISLDRARVDSRFVRANIASNPQIRDQIRRSVNSAGRDVANAKIMNSLRFPWPPIDEQRGIVDIIRAGTNQIVAEQAGLAKLQLLRQGLMTDLLGGRVRVTVGALS